AAASRGGDTALPPRAERVSAPESRRTRWRRRLRCRKDAPRSMPSSERTIHFVSLGCPKNRVDTEVMLGVSGASGYRLTDDASEAEGIVVDTGGFICGA